MSNLNLVKKIAINPLFQLIFAIFLVSCYYSVLSTDTIRFFLTVSSCLRDLLVFVLPFLLFSFLATALSTIPKDGMLFVAVLMGMVFASNFVNILLSGGVGFFILSGVTAREVSSNVDAILPFFTLGLPEIISTRLALAFGVVVGLANSFRPNEHMTLVIKHMHNYVMKFMKNFFVPLLPIFVSGFLLKLFAEGKMTDFLSHNSRVCLLMCGFLLCYLFLWLMAAASFKKDRAVQILKNIFPAVITAFSTMSSAASLPLSLVAAKKNTEDKVLADTVMPLTLNFHMVGDTIIVPILAMAVMLAFNHPLPTVQNFVLFGLFFVLNKFAGGGVPSGTIMVTVPVLKDILGFDDTMIAFTIAFYGVIDPMATAGNVAANNLFVILFKKLRSLITVKKLA